MIKKQYRRGQPGYFDNFIINHDPNDSIDKQLKLYDATIAKSKNKYYRLNIKWHDPEKYMIFVLKWS